MKTYPRPSLCADALVLRPQGEGYQLPLIRRKHAPFAGRWVLPGGFVDEGETTRAAAQRELQEETGVSAEPFLELGVADRPGRDPRGWTVSLVWAFLVPASCEASAGDDAAEAAWFPWEEPPPLGFDHAEVLHKARGRLREQVSLPAGWRALVSPDQEASDALQARIRACFGR